MNNKVRNAKILALRGQKSLGLIAREIGLTRNIVAGVCWRADWPARTCKRDPKTGKRNRSGTGRHGHGEYAAQVLHHPGGKIGRRWKCKPRAAPRARA